MSVDIKDADQFAKIYRHLGPSLVAKVHYLVGSAELSAELVHDVFLSLWSKGCVFADQPALFAWLYKSSHNRAIDHLRSADCRHIDRTIGAQEEALTKPCDAHPEARFEQGQQLRFIAKSLSQEEASILALARLDGLEQAEIAQLLGISVRTVQRRLACVDDKLNKLRQHHQPDHKH